MMFNTLNKNEWVTDVIIDVGRGVKTKVTGAG